jgi:Immunity protein 21
MTPEHRQESPTDTTWVTSLGGPLILIPESACHHWGGAPRDYPDHEGDYGRACAVDGYVGLIDVGTTKALVLGDMPARTTFLPEHGVLFREITADDALDPSATVARLLPEIEWEPKLSWEVTEPVILFDSAYDYPHVIDANEEHLRVSLTPGNYDVQAAYLEVPDEAYLILVRLLATGQDARCPSPSTHSDSSNI